MAIDINDTKLNFIKYVSHNNNVFICLKTDLIMNLLIAAVSSGNCSTKLVCVLYFYTKFHIMYISVIMSLSTQIV